MRLERLLFASVHSYLDPSSGAAVATRDLLECLASHGIDCRVICAGVLDIERETPHESVLKSLQMPYRRARAVLPGRGLVELFDLSAGGVRITLLPTSSSRIEKSPNLAESTNFLSLADQVLERFRPQVLLIYGGHPVNLELMTRARGRGVTVVFQLHNLSYADRRAFIDAAAVVVPSEYARRHYAKRLGLACTVIGPALRPERFVTIATEPRYLTFINPEPAKGLTVFARIAAELDRRRPDIPILIVEGRKTADSLAGAGLDISALRNLNLMANTPDPRDFYKVSRAVLMPSLVPEAFGLVAAESLANGIPVLASDRGALPETLGDAGFVFSLPERCTPTSGMVPTPEEVAPWVATAERLWDDPVFYTRHRDLAQGSARKSGISEITKLLNLVNNYI